MKIAYLGIGDIVDLDNVEAHVEIVDYRPDYELVVLTDNDITVHTVGEEHRVVHTNKTVRKLELDFNKTEIGFGLYESRHDRLPIPIGRDDSRFKLFTDRD